MREGIVFRDRAVYLPAANTLVIADVHLGRGVTSVVDAPLGACSEMFGRLERLLAHFEPTEVVMAGDILHAFEGLPPGVAEALDDLTSLVEDEARATLRLVAGNHDAMIDEVADAVAEYPLGDGETVVCHGHERPETRAPRYLLGHEHPAIDIEGRRHPCFLVGRDPHRDADVVLLPAFNRLTVGTAVNGLRDDDFDSPLVSGSTHLRPVVRDEDADETLTFPPLGRLREFL